MVRYELQNGFGEWELIFRTWSRRIFATGASIPTEARTMAEFRARMAAGGNDWGRAMDRV